MANLPADLPTNWTQGQIISPNGTEVGLSEQYGYNYLNEQVNNTQTEVNSLSTAQTNTQQQVNTLNTQVGNIQSQVNSNDTDISNLQQTTTTQGQSITTLQGQVSTLNQTTTTQGESISTLQGQVDNINTELKSVARQTIYTAVLNTTWAGSSAPFTQEISLSGILATDEPHISPIYSNDNATAIAEKAAWNMISKAVTTAGVITFTCFEEMPEVSLSLNIEVVR